MAQHQFNNQIDEVYENLNDSINTLNELQDISNKRHNWATNASIGLLGFFMAILIQFKMSGDIPNNFFAIIILIYLCSGIVLGLIFKFKYEKNILESKTVDALIPSIKAINILLKQYPPESEKHRKQAKEIDLIVKKNSIHPFTGKIKDNPDFYSKQLYYLALAIASMVIYFSLFLFF